jgi:hypothetical protein
MRGVNATASRGRAKARMTRNMLDGEREDGG